MMRAWMRFLTVLLVIGAALPLRAASEQLRKLQLEVQILKAARDNLEAAYWNSRKQFIDRKKQDADELKRLDDTVQDLVSRRNRIREEQLKFSRQQEDLKQEVGKLDLEIAAINNAFLEILKELRLLYRFNRPLMEPSFPGALDRLEKAIGSAPYAFAKHGTELFTIINGVILRGARAELVATQVNTVNGKLRDAWLIRIGNVYLAYLTKDRQHAGILLHGNGREGAAYRWHEQLPGQFRAQLQAAVDLLLRPQPDAVVRLPVDVLLSKAVAERYAGGSGSLWDRITGLVRRGGPVIYPLFAIALAALVIIFERVLFFRRNSHDNDRFMARLLPELDKQGAAGAAAVHEAAEAARGPLPRLLRGVAGNLQATRDEAYSILQELMLHELPVFEKRLATLKVLGAIAPLLGLLGTVSGMISLFDVITLYGTKDPRLMAGGISEALITTQAGLIIAVPIILCHRLLLNRVNAVSGDLERYGLAVLNRLWKGKQ